MKSFVLNRGHTVRAVCESFHLAKDAGFKVVSHMMPDLPNVGIERDVEQFIVSKHTTDHSLVSDVKEEYLIIHSASLSLF